MRKVQTILLIALNLTIVIAIAMAQQVPNPPAPAEQELPISQVESLRLELAQVKAQLAQQQQQCMVQTAQLSYQLGSIQAQNANADAAREFDAIKRAHNWGDDVRFDPQARKFYAKPAPAKPEARR